MINALAKLVKNVDPVMVERAGLRQGFGEGLREAGRHNKAIVALCADLTESTKMNLFAEEFPDRFVQVGIAEQNLATVAAGMAAMGKIPFTSSYAAFHPGRNWEQIRTTACLNEQPVKIVGSHAGVSVGLDGATHQMLEDIALMRVLPHMKVFAPADAIEAKKVTQAMAKDKKMPNYIRLAREATPVFTTKDTPFEVGKALVLRHGNDVTLVGTGTMSYQLLAAAELLEKDGIDAEVIHYATVKPFDGATLLASVQKTHRVVSAEEGQIAGGFGSAVAEFLAEHHPVHMKRIGIRDHFGESGTPDELMKAYKLDYNSIVKTVAEFL